MGVTKIIGASAIAALLAIGIAGSANAGKGPPPADPVTCDNVAVAAYCDYELQNLCSAIEAGGFKSDRDRFNLIGKVVETADKINMDKFGDAGGKLDDIQSKVDQLVGAAKPKLDEDSADSITFARIEASICVSGLGG